MIYTLYFLICFTVSKKGKPFHRDYQGTYLLSFFLDYNDKKKSSKENHIFNKDTESMQ